VVERAFIVPPASHVGPIGEDEQQRLINSSKLRSKYEEAIDRESAYEKLKAQVEDKQPASAPSSISDLLLGKTGPRGGRQTQGVLEAVTKSAARAIGSELGRQIMRGVLGSILGGGRRR
jgi:hypothetical protein